MVAQGQEATAEPLVGLRKWSVRQTQHPLSQQHGPGTVTVLTANLTHFGLLGNKQLAAVDGFLVKTLL